MIVDNLTIAGLISFIVIVGFLLLSIGAVDDECESDPRNAD